SHDLDGVLPAVDAVYLLRMQQERMTEALIPSLREYTACYGLTARRVDRLGEKAIVMHPGPMNRGVEIAADVADLPRSVVVDQVRNGVAVRMAVLFELLGSGGELERERGSPSPSAGAPWSTPPASAGPTCWSRTAASARSPRAATPTCGPTSCSTPAGAWWRPAWSTSTPTCASRVGRRPRPSR